MKEAALTRRRARTKIRPCALVSMSELISPGNRVLKFEGRDATKSARHTRRASLLHT